MELDVSDKVHEVDFKKTMEQSYTDYAMSAISVRALPDVGDGLKPVQRRVLYSMIKLNNGLDRPYRKCARVVGDIMGKYYSHGDSSVYGALANMAQEWSTCYSLVGGYGNFGSVDGDGAATMRYTEARLSKISMEVLADINKDTADLVPNFDEIEGEPFVLPFRYPNLLVNGTSGIAVGIVTNIPSHNLREITGVVVKMIDNKVEEDRETPLEETTEIVGGPDFPTGTTILGRRGIEEAYRTGRTKIKVHVVINIETMASGKSRIIVTELPYMASKVRLIEKIADLVKEKKIDGITHIGDESSREGMRIDVEPRRDVNTNVTLNQLLKHTQLQDTFGVIMLALINNQPKVLDLYQTLKEYLKHQEEVVTRRTQYDLNKAEEKAHILRGLLIALDNIDEVIRIIHGAVNVADAKNQLMGRFGLSDVQSQAIVDMRLRAPTGLEHEKLENEYRELQAKIEELKAILMDEKKFLTVIRDEIMIISDKYGDDCRTAIGHDDDMSMESLIPGEDTIIAMTHLGYIKHVDVDNFRSQNKGGKGIKGMQTVEEDYIRDLLMTTNHHYMMFFTNTGCVCRLKVYEIPEAGRTARGTAIINLLQLMPEEKITAIIPMRGFNDDKYLLMAIRNGTVKKTPMVEYKHVCKNGLQAIVLRGGDELTEVKTTDNSQDILLVTRKGVCIRFNEADVRVTGRVSMGVTGMWFEDDDEVTGTQMQSQGDNLLVVFENGMGKRTMITELSAQNRGGKGVICYKCTDKTSYLVGAKLVDDDREIMIITTEGIIVRMTVDDVSVVGRNTSGVKLMSIDQDSDIKVANIAKVRESVTEDSDVYDEEYYEEEDRDSKEESEADVDPDETV